MPTYRSSDQTELHYETYGSSDAAVTLLLLHGFPLDGRLWSRVLAPLSEKVRLIVPDLRGFGGSAVPAGPYTMERYAEDALLLLDELGVERAFVGGHSMGGYVALAMAEAQPSRVAGLALLHSHPFADDEAGRKGRYELAATIGGVDRDAWNRAMRIKMSTADYKDTAGVKLLNDIVASARPEAIAESSKGMALRPDRSEVWRGFEGPALFVYGQHDAFITAARAEAVRALRDMRPVDGPGDAPNGRYAELPGGHVSMVEVPEGFVHAVSEWIVS